MRLSLMIEGQENVTWPQAFALAEACERHGLEGMFSSDHYHAIGGEGGGLDTWTMLAGVAARTERIRLGALVSPATFRHPSTLAKAAVTVDHISGGRVEVGMGAGWYEREHRAYGFAYPSDRERIDLLAEQVEVVVAQWTSTDPVDMQGRHYRLEALRADPKPVQRPRPPLILGGRANPRSLALAARWADEYNTVNVGPQECARRRALLDQACRAAGRDPGTIRFSLMATCAVGRDEPELAERIRAIAGDVDPTEFLQQRGSTIVAGTVGQVVERLRALERAGVDRVMLQHLAPADLDMVALIGDEVLPAVT